MQRHQLSAVCAAALLLFAGISAFAGAGVASSGDQRRAVGAATPNHTQQQVEPGPEPVNVTIETLRLRNVALLNVSISDITIRGNVTTANGTVIATPNGSKTVKNITARWIVTNATLHNVTFTGMRIRDDTIVDALFGEVEPIEATPGNRTIETATLRTLTVNGLVVEHATVDNARLATVRTQGAQDIGTEAGAEIRNQPAVEIRHGQADKAVVERITAIDLVVVNATGDPTGPGDP